jgi:hypothetical protein
VILMGVELVSYPVSVSGRQFWVVTFGKLMHPIIGTLVPLNPQSVVIACRDVWKELVNYMEGDLTPEMRARIDQHLRGCNHCTAVYDGTHNVVQLLGDDKAIDLPQGFSQRLYLRLINNSGS